MQRGVLLPYDFLSLHPITPSAGEMSKAILIDTTRCVGCQRCVVACKFVNGLLKGSPADFLTTDTLKPLGPDTDLPMGESGDEELSANALNVVQAHGSVYVRRFCMHCQDPTCVSVCPVGAFRKTPEGPVVYAEERCMGCRYCMMACPFGVPRYEWNKVWAPRVRKCHMCAPRQAKGLKPACTEVCPVQAGVFGEREDLLREAENRLKQEPTKYIQHIYGKEEVGGTSVLYLSAVPFEALGLPANLPHDALPGYTYRVLSRIPSVVTLGGALLGGIWWMTKRREEVAKAEKEERKAQP
jgi:formate dehydrogenase iron-sulfur subunit